MSFPNCFFIRTDDAVDTAPAEPFTLYGTLPRSMRETKLVTNVKSTEDPEALKVRQELVRSKSPAELADIKGFSDIPVPAPIQNMFKVIMPKIIKVVTKGQTGKKY